MIKNKYILDICNIARYPDMRNVHIIFITYIHRT